MPALTNFFCLYSARFGGSASVRLLLYWIAKKHKYLERFQGSQQEFIFTAMCAKGIFLISFQSYSPSRVLSQIWSAILDKSALTNPKILASFALITFADLKKYKFFYWFGFPALLPATPFHLSAPPSPLSSRFDQIAFATSYSKFKAAFPEQAGFFLIRRQGEAAIEFGKIADWKSFWANGDEVTVGFADPSSQPSHPGWPLR
jgi:hypothetical protein